MIIKTKIRDVSPGELPINFVCAYEPEPHDSFVETYLTVVDGQKLLTTQTIDQYQAALDWAVKMADQMACPITLLPITAEEFLRNRWQQMERALGAMTDQERGVLRGHIVQAMAEVVRDCDDADVRAEVCDVLVKLDRAMNSVHGKER